MTISFTQAILLGLFCGLAKTCIPYTWGAFVYNTVIFNAVMIGAIMGNMTQAMIVGASLQLIYLGVIAAGGNQPSDPCLAAYIAIPVALVSGLDTNAAVALAVPVGLLGVQISNLLYLMAGFFAQKGDKLVEQGNAAGMTRWSVIYVGIIRCLAFAVPVTIALYFGAGMMQGVLNDIPKWLTNGLSAMGACLPAVGFAIIANLISKPKFVPFFFAFLYLTFTAKDYTASADDDEDEDEDEDEEDEVEAAGLRQRLLSKGEVFKSWTLWWIFAEVGHSFERMQAPMFCTAMAPALKKFYKGNKERYIEALKRHMIFFNTEAHWGGGPCLGLSLAMEEKKSQAYDEIPGEMIVNLKTGLMGPLAGIGDTIVWSTLMYLFIGLFLPLAQKGNPIGGIGPIVCLTTVCFIIGYILTERSYTYGYSFAENMLKSGLVNIIIAGASILGLFMMGGLASTYVTVTTPLKIATSTYTTTIQSILDSILPGILPLVVVLLVWKYLSKSRNYFKATIGLTIASLVLGCIGVII